MTILTKPFAISDLCYITNNNLGYFFFYSKYSLTFSTSPASIQMYGSSLSYTFKIYNEDMTEISESTTFSPGIHIGSLGNNNTFSIYRNL